MAGQIHTFGAFEFDGERRVLRRDGKSVALGQRALALLQTLLEAKGEAVSKDELMRVAWQGALVEESNLTVQVAALRKALGPAPGGGEWITTVQRVGYAFAHPGEDRKAALHFGQTTLPELPTDRPSIAVLPFVNFSGGSDHDFLATGLTEDIIAALSRVREFFVISRTTTFYYKDRIVPATEVARELAVRYILEGGVRVAGDKLRVTVQLVDGRSGNAIWAEKFDSGIGDIFAVQDDITRNIVLAMQVKLSYGAFAGLWDGQTKNLKAWELMARGRDLFLKFNPISNREAQAALHEALAIDPTYTGAMVQLGLCHWWQARYDESVDRDLSLSLCEAQISCALAIDPRNGAAYMLKGGNAFLRDRHAEAIAHCEEAVALAPNDSWAMAFLGLVATYGGATARAVETLKLALRLSPYPPHWYIESYATAHLWHGDLPAATMAAEENLRLEPDDMDAHLVAAMVFGITGRKADAARVVRSLMEKHPSYGIHSVRRSERYSDPNRTEQVVAVMREAGLRE